MLGISLELWTGRERVNQFNKIMDFARSIIDETEVGQKENKSTPVPHPLIDVIRLLGRDLQTKYLSQLLFEEKESSLSPRHLKCPLCQDKNL